jgi:hypothetical protein
MQLQQAAPCNPHSVRHNEDEGIVFEGFELDAWCVCTYFVYQQLSLLLPNNRHKDNLKIIKKNNTRKWNLHRPKPYLVEVFQGGDTAKKKWGAKIMSFIGAFSPCLMWEGKAELQHVVSCSKKLRGGGYTLIWVDNFRGSHFGFLQFPGVALSCTSGTQLEPHGNINLQKKLVLPA